MRANPTDYNDWQLEVLDEDGKTPHFLHSPDCPNYCDYACIGFEQAEAILKNLILNSVFTELQ